MNNPLTHCPSTLQANFSTYSPAAIRALFNGARVSPYLDFEFVDYSAPEIATGRTKNISVSGVQEKFGAVIENGRLRLSGRSEQSTHILKPAPFDPSLPLRKQIPANEHVTMQIASQVYGISTAVCGMCFTPSGKPVYVTRRFDITPTGSKIALEDAAGLIWKDKTTNITSNSKYEGCYKLIANVIRENVSSPTVDLERFFELLVFNYIYANGDAHLKNFSLMQADGEVRLSPAYDLINTALHISGDDFALDHGLSDTLEHSDTYLRTSHPCRSDFELFAVEIGLNQRRIKRICDKYSSISTQVLTLLNNSFLNDKMKRSYLRIITERTQRFIRRSE